MQTPSDKIVIGAGYGKITAYRKRCVSARNADHYCLSDRGLICL